MKPHEIAQIISELDPDELDALARELERRGLRVERKQEPTWRDRGDLILRRIERDDAEAIALADVAAREASATRQYEARLSLSRDRARRRAERRTNYLLNRTDK